MTPPSPRSGRTKWLIFHETCRFRRREFIIRHHLSSPPDGDGSSGRQRSPGGPQPHIASVPTTRSPSPSSTHSRARTPPGGHGRVACLVGVGDQIVRRRADHKCPTGGKRKPPGTPRTQRRTRRRPEVSRIDSSLLCAPPCSRWFSSEGRIWSSPNHEVKYRVALYVPSSASSAHLRVLRVSTAYRFNAEVAKERGGRGGAVRRRFLAAPLQGKATQDKGTHRYR